MLILIKYGPQNPAEKWKIEAATDKDDVVLIQDGVIWAVTDDIDPYLNRTKFHALDVDLDARGYKKETSKASILNYDEMVSLIEKQQQSMS